MTIDSRPLCVEMEGKLRVSPVSALQRNYFYERSINGIGILKDWLAGALALALENGEETLSNSDL